MQVSDWRCTTREAAWQPLVLPLHRHPVRGFRDFDVLIQPDQPRQTMRGFGATFNELGWDALSALPADQREALLHQLFAPGAGLNLRICRLPMGASDFARDWYACHDQPGDFGMQHFDASRDLAGLVPYIQAAQRHQPGLQLWASPWSPPTWMKHNRHYAMVPPPVYLPANGLASEQAWRSADDAFIVDDRHLAAYALYFRRFVEFYRAQGIPIGMVMPQNEFNSAQFFPSCVWTAQGLARFIAHLGPEMRSLGVQVYLGTLERPLPEVVSAVLADPDAAPHVQGVGLQWAARRSAATIALQHPSLDLLQSEQECGDGRNDWRFARHAWTMMREFIQAGASTYTYWNIALPDPGVSSWGWKQNAMVSVDMASGRYRLNPDLHVLQHLSHAVQPGARRLETVSITGHENLLAFRNPDGSTVVAVQNDGTEPLPLRLALDGQMLEVTLPADSINTLLL